MNFKKNIFLLLFLSIGSTIFSQTIKDLEKVAKENGVSSSEISKLKKENTKQSSDENTNDKKNQENLSKTKEVKPFGHQGDSLIMQTKNPLFGFDFFSNENISFSPNLNLATPENYQLGPGDELLIDVWGAAENSYNTSVGREGAIKIENIGPVYVSGLSIKEAKNKIISSLRKIYSGINASSNSYNKVNVSITLVNVRTVQVNIIGEVKVPGTYSLSALSSVLNALYASGGPTENGTFRAIKVYRSGKEIADFDIYKYLIDGNQKGNIFLRDQDVVIVSPYKNKVNVKGNVKRPGDYELKENENISDLITYFGGFKANAYKDIINVKRINGGQKEINEINLNTQKSFVLKAGDHLTIGAVINEYKNKISIKGAVYRPGDYELIKGLTLKELINKAGLKNDAFLQRGIIIRKINLSNNKMLSFSLTDILNGSKEIELKKGDAVQVFSEKGLREKYTVSIDGAVNKPQKIPFVENMLLEDFIAISGGFKEGADVNVIDVSRRINDDNFKTISKNIKRSASGNLLINSSDNFYLKPFDKVSIRYKKGYSGSRIASIKGEVSYPGNYTITNEEERISDLIDEAGGLSPYAYVKGATLIRKASQLNDSELSSFIGDFSKKIDTLGTVELEKKEFPIGIRLDKIIKDKGSKYDLILKEGDVLFIPSQKQTVQIKGEVLAPTAVRFDKAKSLKDYINNSGGFTENARRTKAYVVYPNGEIKSTKRFLFFKSYPKIEPGASIIVPHKNITRNPLSIQEVLGITTSITTLGILINSLAK